MKSSKLIMSIFFIMVSFMLANCASVNNSNTNKEDYINSPKVSAIIHNQQSMTTSLKKLDNNLSVKVLYSGLENKQYKRFVTIKLESTPVIVAVSSTPIQDKTFYDILSDSDNNSIGLKLFAPNSGIKRDPNMLITKIKIANIDSTILRNYLLSNGYSNNQLIAKRTSVFRHGNEFMELTEYILPSVSQFFH